MSEEGEKQADQQEEHLHQDRRFAEKASGPRFGAEGLQRANGKEQQEGQECMK